MRIWEALERAIKHPGKVFESDTRAILSVDEDGFLWIQPIWGSLLGSDDLESDWHPEEDEESK